MGAGIDIFQLTNVVFPCLPERICGQGDGIGYTKILERAQQLFLERLGQPNFSGKSISKILGNAGAIHSLRGCRKTQKNLRGKAVKDGTVACGWTMMYLIHDDEGRRNPLPLAPINAAS